MKIYTRKGDDGTTSLIGGGGNRVSKASERVEAYGTLDELMAHLGVLHDSLGETHFVRQELRWILSRVMDCAAILASEDPHSPHLPVVEAIAARELEAWTDNHLDGLPALRHFTLPVGGLVLSYANVCRTVCRRAERRIVAVANSGAEVPVEVGGFINRLSDYLYALGRRLGHEIGATDVTWEKARS